MAHHRLTSLIVAIGFVSFIALSFTSCEDPASDPKQAIPSDLIASDFINLSSELTWDARIVGTETRFDTNGKTISVETIDDGDRKVMLAGETMINGVTVRPVFASDADGLVKGVKPIFYLGTKDGSIFAISHNQDVEITALPKELKNGNTWVPSAEMPPRHKSTLTISEYLKEFTNNAGKTYKDVIKTVAVFNDSSSFEPGTDGGILEGTLEVYFAKGVGPVEFHMPSGNRWEQRRGKFRRENYTGKLSRK